MQGKECTCASIELAKRRVSSRMITTDKINHGLKIRRGKSLGLFTRSSLIGTLMRAGFFITVIPICASAQTRKQITATQEQIAAQQAQKNADLAISQRDALQAQLEDTALAASRRDSAPSTAPATQDLTFPPAAPSPSPSPAETPVEMTPVPERGDDATPRAAVLGQDGGAATPDKVQEGAVRAPQGEPSAGSTPAATRPRAQGRHGYRPQPPARPKPQLTFWQRLFGHKEPKKAEPRKPRP